jgi:hypothetical protein
VKRKRELNGKQKKESREDLEDGSKRTTKGNKEKAKRRGNGFTFTGRWWPLDGS